MKLQDIDNQISLKQKEIAMENDPNKRSKIQKELTKLGLKKEIEFIKRRIDSIG